MINDLARAMRRWTGKKVCGMGVALYVSKDILDFFSSSVADVALKARSLHEHKQEILLYKDKKVL